MIPARKFPLGEQLVWYLIKSSVRKHFDRVFFRMQGELSAEQRKLPMIICANHSSWWDGYAAALVMRHLKLDGYLMMEEAQLRRYRFFSWVGCFSVDRQDARSAMQSIHYAAALLKERPNRMVWLFPQGEISPNDRRPLVFFSGAIHLARLATPALLYPCGLRIEYLAEQRPDLYISLGQPLLVDAQTIKQPRFLQNYTHLLEEQVSAEIDQLHADVVASDYADFTRIMHGKASTNRLFDSFMLRKQMRHQ